MLASLWGSLTTTKSGVILVLFTAALLESSGDFFWSRCLHTQRGGLVFGFLAVVFLSLYGFFFNSTNIEFREVVGGYIVCFFLWIELLAYLDKRSWPPRNVIVGGVLIIIGGSIMHFWRATK